METSPLLARRRIAGSERLQKAVLALLVTGVVAALLVWHEGGVPATGSRAFIALLLIAGVGLMLSLYAGFRRNDTAKSKEGMQMVRMRIADDRAGRHWLARSGINLKLALGRIVAISGLAVVAAAAFVLLRQVYDYVMLGEWLPRPMAWYAGTWLDALARVDASPWRDAMIWMLQNVHVSLPLGFGGLFIAGLGNMFIRRTRERALQRY